MVAKAVFLFCAQALLAQCISGQCLRSGYNGIINDGYAAPWNVPYVAEAPWAAGPYAVAPCAERIEFRPSNGGGFPVTSVSPISVTGITMTSENAYEGAVAVSGSVPFLGAVALEGGLPTAGVGAVSYGCGNGEVGMLSERINGYGAFAGPYGYGAAETGYGYGPLGYEAGIAGPGYGYNRGCGCGGPFY